MVPATGAQVANGVEECQPIRASLPRSCKKTSDVKTEDTPSNMPAEKMKPEKKPSNYQSAVARHLAESKECAMAFSDSSFRVVRGLFVEFEPGNHGGSVHQGFSTKPLCAEVLHCTFTTLPSPLTPRATSLVILIIFSPH